MKYAFMQEHHGEYNVGLMSRVLGVSRSGYYAFSNRGPGARAERKMKLQRAMEEVVKASRGTYGSPRVYAQLKGLGIACSRSTVERVMKAAGLVVKRKRSYRKTTDSKHGMPVATNLVKQEFAVSERNKLWLGDITYLRTQEGWMYLAVVMDARSRKVVGWSFSESLQTSLVVRALEMAALHREVVPGLVFHSDRGSQYASAAYQEVLARHGIVPSMSRKGNCYDNAVVESFFHTMKSELPEVFSSRASARNLVFEWMEGFYNTRRLHSSLGYVSPKQFESREALS